MEYFLKDSCSRICFGISAFARCIPKEMDAFNVNEVSDFAM